MADYILSKRGGDRYRSGALSCLLAKLPKDPLPGSVGSFGKWITFIRALFAKAVAISTVFVPGDRQGKSKPTV